MANKIQLRRDTAQNWTDNNPVLSNGEPGVETDTGKLKIGDGSTNWNSLAYIQGSGGGAVDSVNTQTGVVVLDADDIDNAATNNKFVTGADLTKLGNTSGTNTGDETTGTIQSKRPLKTINSESLDGAGNIAISGGVSSWPALTNKPRKAVEDATVNINQTIDPIVNQSYFWNLTGNIDLTIDDTNMSDGETYVFNVEVTTTGGTETITFTDVETEIYGTYDASAKSKLTFEVSKLATAGLKINVFINQPT